VHTGAAVRGTERECSDLMRRLQVAQNMQEPSKTHLNVTHLTSRTAEVQKVKVAVWLFHPAWRTAAVVARPARCIRLGMCPGP
jgi:hypothetical protein